MTGWGVNPSSRESLHWCKNTNVPEAITPSDAATVGECRRAREHAGLVQLSARDLLNRLEHSQEFTATVSLGGRGQQTFIAAAIASQTQARARVEVARASFPGGHGFSA